MLKAFRYLFFYELLLFFRRSQEWLYPLIFFSIVLSLFPLAISPDPLVLQKIAPGVIWIAALLASILALENIFQSDIEEGYLEQLLLSSHPLSWLLLAKISAHWLVAELPLIILAPFLAWVFHLSSVSMLTLLLSLLLGTPIISLVGTFGVALTLGLRNQGVLLSLLILPLLVPVLIFAVSTVQQSEAGLPVIGNFAMLGGLLFLALSLLPWATASVLRLSVDC